MERKGGWTGVALAAALLLPSGRALSDSSEPPNLRKAAVLFNAGSEEKAERELLRLLASKPSAADAAHAHVYLALIKLNRLDTPGAEEELTEALQADVLVELPYDAPPKAEALFEQVRAKVRAKNHEAEKPLVQAPTAAPLVVVQPEVTVAPEQKPGPSHALSLTVGGVAIAAAVVGLVFEGVSAAALSSANAASSNYASDISLAKSSQTEQDVANWTLVGAGSALAVGIGIFLIERAAGSPAEGAASGVRSAISNGVTF